MSWSMLIERLKNISQQIRFKKEYKTPTEKNLEAMLILTAGLFVGSLFVDLGQMITGAGFSGHALRNQNVVSMSGKTWVAYTEPKVNLSVLTDSECSDCNPDEALTWLRRIVPTMNAEKIEASSVEGKSLIQQYNLKTLPAFIFDTNIKATSFYTQAGPLFSEQGSHFVFDMGKIGLPVGKYLQTPAQNDGDALVGKGDAPVRLTVFSDFDCEYCRAYHTVLKHVLANYGEKVSLLFKHLPLPNHPQSQNAALASLCANEQGKFIEYADKLFDRPADWDQTTGMQKFKIYAYSIRGLDTRAYGACLDSKKYMKNIEADMQAAEDYNVSAAPATFINSEFVNGAAPYPDMKSMIDSQLKTEGQ